ncbi:methyltransferase domain-containing protein [Neoroseomonas soli]|uniref:Class I SAM-dependent methyltransferase n=1 Tax=Neoroseomonas soli TaxID=1081025 RepID=A0A9X9X406_9PROT|nr:methyltransferase domain-containing protein [Neoroseomonas soli]MBR0674135.1 class I SAM-dependent methyltransferase [Neoroseomonas soli]
MNHVPTRRLRPLQGHTEPALTIERFSLFHGVLHVTGHAFCGASPVAGLTVLLGDGRRLPVARHDLPSPELTRQHGSAAAACAFDEQFAVGPDANAVLGARMEIRLADGKLQLLPLGVHDQADPVVPLINRFFGMLRDLPPGHMLEIGSRNRTGNMQTGNLPPGWRYTGFDILEGENVDVVGDAHAASTFLPHGEFDAVMSFAVFEHLLMPWKAVVEMNRVLRIGTIGLIAAPQTWSLHEEPCDYFRFSGHAWKALLNRATGFELLDVVHGPRAYIVAKVFNVATNFGEVHTGALMSAALFRKTAETKLDWPVSLDDIADDLYPM